MRHKDDTEKYRHLDDVDIFSSLGIEDEHGNIMSDNNLNPLMGYQIVHKITGRRLPHTQDYEIMGADYAQIKYAQVYNFYHNTEYEEEIGNYIFEPVYLSELDNSGSGFLLLYTDEDHENFGLFK